MKIEILRDIPEESLHAGQIVESDDVKKILEWNANFRARVIQA